MTSSPVSSRSSRRTTANTSSSGPPAVFPVDMADASQPLLATSNSRSISSRRFLPTFDVSSALQRSFRAAVSSGPALRVALLGSLAVGFGVLVLLHTQSLATTSDLPRSSIRAAKARQASRLQPMVAGAANCSELFFTQRVDHFSWLGEEDGSAKTYEQRYLVNSQFWDAEDPRATVFFYTGNEGDVTMYANHTGLMWENAPEFKALIVFAEHRYYGKSFPFGDRYMEHLEFLTHDQALADYTTLLLALQREHKALNHPVIAFGGSYGGMLSAWMRIKYPGVVAGAIAASAPIFGFGGYDYDGQKYWQVVTRDATPAAGAAHNCAPNIHRAWPALFELASTVEGREKLSGIFKLCDPMKDESDGEKLAMGLLVAFDSLAMGNFPYPSSYMTSGGVDLPAWPVRAACEHLADKFDSNETLLAAMLDASNVYYNASHDQECFKMPTLWDIDGIWDYQYCTEMLPQETYFSTNGETDMFWKRDSTLDDIRAHCRKQWKVDPDPDWIRESYGDELLRGASNIVFTNGLLDPWSSQGVLEAPKGARGIEIVLIEEGAHHLDLFFSRPALDPPSVVRARRIEIEAIRRWVDDFAKYK